MSKDKVKKQDTIKPQAKTLALLKADVWVIDSTVDGFIQVYIRDQVFKIKPEQLVFLEDLYGEGDAV